MITDKSIRPVLDEIKCINSKCKHVFNINAFETIPATSDNSKSKFLLCRCPYCLTPMFLPTESIILKRLAFENKNYFITKSLDSCNNNIYDFCIQEISQAVGKAEGDSIDIESMVDMWIEQVNMGEEPLLAYYNYWKKFYPNIYIDLIGCYILQHPQIYNKNILKNLISEYKSGKFEEQLDLPKFMIDLTSKTYITNPAIGREKEKKN